MGKIADTVRQIVELVEKKTGVLFDDGEVVAVYEHTERKMELNGAADDYFPTLFENELMDHLMRRRINLIGQEV